MIYVVIRAETNIDEAKILYVGTDHYTAKMRAEHYESPGIRGHRFVQSWADGELILTEKL